MNQFRRFIQDCVNLYAHYYKIDEQYSLKVSDLPDFVVHEFAALIMSDNESYAAEATGPDNPHWNNKMLPAMTKYLSNSTDKDTAIEFNNIWRDCVADYMKGHMQKLIDSALYEFNDDHGYIRAASYYNAAQSSIY